MSNRLLILKRWRIVIGLTIGLIIYFITFGKSRSQELQEIYRYQESIADIVDLEIQYMPKRISPEEDRWIKTNNLDGQLYSAYLEARPEFIVKFRRPWGEMIWAFIRIIAILPVETETSQIECIFKYDSDSETSILRNQIAREVKQIYDPQNIDEYTTSFVICDLADSNGNYNSFYNERKLPESVGIQWINSKRKDLEFVDIHYPKNGMKQYSKKPDEFMAVCVPVLHHKFNRTLELIEFIEYYKLMAVDHFTFYNSSISPEVNKVLEFYMRRDTASVLNWNLPSIFVNEQTLRQEEIFAALNDCLYRNSLHESYRYVGTFDVDEFLIPRHADNFTRLMDLLDPDFPEDLENPATSFLFRNVFFYSIYGDDEKQREIRGQSYLRTRAKTTRLKKPHEARDRSRYFVRGQNIVELGHYNARELREGSSKSGRNGFGEIVVDPEVALLHHYSPCEDKEIGCYFKPTEIDRSAQRFSKRLEERVEASCRMIFGKKGCPPPAKH